jgi:hypothetical protein
MFSGRAERLSTEDLELATNVTHAAAMNALRRTAGLRTGVLEELLRIGEEAAAPEESRLYVAPPAATSFTAVVHRNIVFHGNPRDEDKFDSVLQNKLESEFHFVNPEDTLRTQWKDNIWPCTWASVLSAVSEGDGAFVVEVAVLDPVLSITVVRNETDNETLPSRLSMDNAVKDGLRRALGRSVPIMDGLSGCG